MLPSQSEYMVGTREVVISDETGYLTAPEGVGELSDALARLAGDEDLRRRLGAEGQRRFTRQFRHEEMTQQLRRLYQQLLVTSGPGT